VNPNDYIQAVKDYIRNPAIEGTYNNAVNPPGRQIIMQQKEISIWLESLPAKERQYVQCLIQSAVDSAIFGYLCSLDGVRKITDEPGEFRLLFKSEDRECLLNTNASEYLHDLYRR